MIYTEIKFICQLNKKYFNRSGTEYSKKFAENSAESKRGGPGKLAKPRKCPRSWKCQSLRRALGKPYGEVAAFAVGATSRSCRLRLRLRHVDPLTFRRSFDVYRINLPVLVKVHQYSPSRCIDVNCFVLELMKQRCGFMKGAIYKERAKKEYLRVMYGEDRVISITFFLIIASETQLDIYMLWQL